VRKTEVDVENLDAQRSRDASFSGSRPSTSPGASTGGAYADYDSDFRTHWQSNYGSAGGAYEDYQPAYQYGSTLAADDRYRNRGWDDIEMDARRDWDTRHPGGTWERFKAAVRHGWERVTNKR
jgi:hypothetical protein